MSKSSRRSAFPASAYEIHHEPERPVTGISVAIVPVQCRAARALLGWSQLNLAEAAAVCRATLAELENGNYRPLTRTLVEIQQVLGAASIMSTRMMATRHSPTRSAAMNSERCMRPSARPMAPFALLVPKRSP